MSRPKAHYGMVIKNHLSGARLKVELIDLPFSTGVRLFRLRVNGQWARKMPVASKTIVTKASARMAGEALEHFAVNGPGKALAAVRNRPLRQLRRMKDEMPRAGLRL